MNRVAAPERLFLILPGSDTPLAPAHWSFGQLASQIGAPAAYLRQLPAALAGINLQYGLTFHRAEQIKTLETDNSRVELRAVTGPDYGRIFREVPIRSIEECSLHAYALIAGQENPTNRNSVHGRHETLALSSLLTEIG